MLQNNEFCDVYVRATCKYEYVHKGNNVRMDKGETFLLIKKSSEDWWQVIRKGEVRPFFAPRQYLEETDVSIEVMKHSLRKKIAHQRNLQHQQRLYEETRKRQSLDGNENFAELLSNSPGTTQKSRGKFHSKNISSFHDTDHRSLDAANSNIGGSRKFSDKNRSLSIKKSQFEDRQKKINEARLALQNIPDDSSIDNIVTSSMYSEHSVSNTQINEIINGASDKLSSPHGSSKSLSVREIPPPSSFDQSVIDGPNDNFYYNRGDKFQRVTTYEGNNDTYSDINFNNPSKEMMRRRINNDSLTLDSGAASLMEMSEREFDKDVGKTLITGSPSLRTSIVSLNSSIHSGPPSSNLLFKSSSYDVIQSTCRSLSPVDVLNEKAKSSEELDSAAKNHITQNLLAFQSNILSQRNRSNSFDTRPFCPSESNAGDKPSFGRKLRISKDPLNRRRSWAMSDIHSLKTVPVDSLLNYTLPDESDVSIILDVPPQLPPKLKKGRGSLLSLNLSQSSDSLGSMEGPIDIRVEEAKRRKETKFDQMDSAVSSTCPVSSLDIVNTSKIQTSFVSSTYYRETSITNSLTQGIGSLSVGKSNTLVQQLKQDFEGTESSSSDKEESKFPSALRKNILSKFDSSSRNVELPKKGLSSKESNITGTAIDDSIVSIEESNTSMVGSDAVDGNIVKSTQMESKTKFGNLESVSEQEKAVNAEKEISPTNNSSKAKLHWKKLQHFVDFESTSLNETKVKEIEISQKKERRVGDLIQQMENEAKKKLEECDKSGTELPPSPTGEPLRIVFDCWGEYLDTETERPFFYNKITREKRWKPPRKKLTNAISNKISTPPLQHKGKLGVRPSLNVVSTATTIPPSLPVLPPPPLWPHRERSFTTLGFTPTNLLGTAAIPYATPALPHNYNPPSPALQPKLLSHCQSIPLQPIGGLPNTIHALTTEYQQPDSPTKTRSFLSTISNSFSFMKSSSNSSSSNQPPSPPPSSAKPFVSAPIPIPKEVSHEKTPCLQSALDQFSVPPGWVRKYDAYTQMMYFKNIATSEKWHPAITKSGTVYVYPADGGESKWTLPEYDSTESLQPKPSLADDLKEHPYHSSYLTWCFYLREGKRVKKNWATSFVRYFPLTQVSSAGDKYGRLTFSKSPDDKKKSEYFDLVPPCGLDANVKKTNRQHVLCLRNGKDTEVLLQAKDAKTAQLWAKVLNEKDKVQERNYSPERLKKNKKNADKHASKFASTEDLTSPSDSKGGLKQMLLSYLKRRPAQETLVKKGIYKDSVFGNHLSELCSVKDNIFVPIFVLRCINNIEKDGENFKVDGLYRISGNAARIQKIRFEVAQNRYEILDLEKDVHNLSGALKLFLRELKEPLVPFKNYQSFIEATGSEYLKNRSRSDVLKQAVRNLPKVNLETLRIVLQHLLTVNQHSTSNRMSLMNLAIVFGPCLLWPEPQPTVPGSMGTSGFDPMTDVMLHNRVVEALMTEFDLVFS